MTLLIAMPRRYLKVSPFPVDRPREVFFAALPGRFFFIFSLENYNILAISCPIFKRISPFYSKNILEKKRISGRPGELIISHPVETFFLVLP